MPNYCPNCGESLGSHSSTASSMAPVATPGRVKKVKRKASAYNKRYAKAYKSLKKKHPRTSFAGLAKKAHRLARRK